MEENNYAIVFERFMKCYINHVIINDTSKNQNEFFKSRYDDGLTIFLGRVECDKKYVVYGENGYTRLPGHSEGEVAFLMSFIFPGFEVKRVEIDYGGFIDINAD